MIVQLSVINSWIAIFLRVVPSAVLNVPVSGRQGPRTDATRPQAHADPHPAQLHTDKAYQSGARSVNSCFLAQPGTSGLPFGCQ